MKLRVRNRGFTLIELLVVIAIIGILSSVILTSLTGAKTAARDAERKEELAQLSRALELCYNDACNGAYPATVGYLSNLVQFGGPNTSFNIITPKYIPSITNDPNGNGGGYVYWRKDYSECSVTPGDASANKYSLYAKLENPSAADLATINDDSIDRCMAGYGYNYRVGN